ncbi:MAG TPA: aldo/keto reductase [Rhodocyclaceae bacterium]|nr:aldo/keto reductase [Rhodocyclaceae bacterium]
MRFNTLGDGGPQVSEICLGTMTWGTQNTEADAHAQLDAAFAAGVNFVDTAEMYSVPATAESYGRSETYIGTWLRRQPRDRVVLATKVCGPGRTMKWVRNGDPGLDRANLRSALEASLRRLQTDYVDLYQLHWPDRNTPLFGGYQFDPARERPSTPIRDTLEALAELVGEGKIRHVGLSNETPWGVMQFMRLAEDLDLPRIVAVQNAYSLLNRTWEAGLAEIGHRERIGLLAYSPLAFGYLTGKYFSDPPGQGRINLFENFGQRYTKENVVPAARAYCDLARRHGHSPTQMALAFVRSRWFVATTIVGATSLGQLTENLASVAVTPSAELLREIEAIHLRYTNPAP